MVDARLDDAREVGNKLLSKGSRWRTKYFAKDDPQPEEQQPTTKRADTFKLDDDVNDFLKPSTDKAQAQAQAQQHAAAAFLSAKPKIDVARAQRWPGAQAILSSAAANGKTPGPGGLRRSRPEQSGADRQYGGEQPGLGRRQERGADLRRYGGGKRSI